MNQSEQLKKMEEQIVMLEKTAQIGRLTAGILHEIRNPLNFVINFTKLSAEINEELSELDECETKEELLEEIADIQNTLSQNLKKINDNAERAMRVISQMLAGASNQKPQPELAEINVLVEDFVKLAYQGMRGNNSKFNCTLNFKFNSTIGKQKIVTSDFTRVILNISGNAFYALNEKLKTNPDFKPVFDVETKPVKDYFIISFRDNGNGIEEAIREKIFDAFFSTKPPSEGTGLGLAMCADIVKNTHKGKIELESKPEEFTQFTVYFSLNI